MIYGNININEIYSNKVLKLIDIINLYFYSSFFLGGSFASKNYPDNYPNKYDEVIFRSSRIKYQPTKLIHYYSDMEVGVL